MCNVNTAVVMIFGVTPEQPSTGNVGYSLSVGDQNSAQPHSAEVPLPSISTDPEGEVACGAIENL